MFDERAVAVEELRHVQSAGEGIAHQEILVARHVVRDGPGKFRGRAEFVRQQLVSDVAFIDTLFVAAGARRYVILIVFIGSVLLRQAEQQVRVRCAALACRQSLERETAVAVGFLHIVVHRAPHRLHRYVLAVGCGCFVGQVRQVVQRGCSLVPSALVHGG